jgi:hypothetical protein
MKKIDITTLEKLSIQQNIQETLGYLYADPRYPWSWGVDRKTVLSGKILRFEVSGLKHKGLVYIILNGSDLFNVYIANFKREVISIFENLYFDQLVEVIDCAIETDSNYQSSNS